MSKTVTIEALGAVGDGLARQDDGRVIFVPGGLPGELYDAATSARVSAPSPERVAPPCRYFGRCGGCLAQHMSADLYARWKRDAVVGAFRQHGIDIAIGDLVPVAPDSRRRVTFAVARLREPGKSSVLRLGFHERGSHDFVPIDDCRVITPRINAALPALARLVSALGSVDEETRLHVADLPDGLDIVLQGKAKLSGADQRRLLAQRAAEAGAARLTIGDDIIVERAVPLLPLARGGVVLPPGAFFQAVEAAERAIVGSVIDAVGKAKRIADLFAGIGTLTLPLAGGARVLAVDTVKESLFALEDAARREPGLKPVETKLRDLFREPLSPKELETFDAVVVDPPRSGAKAQAEMLARSAVPVIAMVSCSPATLARDVRILIDSGYTLDWVRPIDQFIWSDHVEAVARLSKPKNRRK